MRHVAVIGSGPAGYYTAEGCRKAFGDDVRRHHRPAAGALWPDPHRRRA